MASKVRALRRGGTLTRSEKKETGPSTSRMIAFDDLKSESEIAGELKRLRSLEIVRLVDVVVVAKSKGGGLVPVKAGALEPGGLGSVRCQHWQARRLRGWRAGCRGR